MMKIRMNNTILRIALIGLLFCGLKTSSFAQEVENNYQYRFGLDMNWTLLKGLKVNFAPQMRFEEGFEQFQLGAGLRYKTFGFLYWGANFRLEVEPSDEYVQGADKYGRYAFDVTARKKYGDFTPSLRMMYSNYTNADITDSEYFRYRAMVKYDIPKCPITPYVSAEAFQELAENMLYKMRYTAGFDFKVKKGRYLNFNYKLDYFILDYKNRHIFDIGYKFDF
ncbi:MAG: DUF2490 domain-containing protein [Rikenellaceae bacterium]